MKLKLTLLLVSLGILSGRAAVISWTNTAGGSWQTAANWEPNQVPAAADTALITTPGAYTVTLAANVTVAQFTLGGLSGAQSLSLGTRTLAATTLGKVAANGVLLMPDNSGLEGNVTVDSGGALRFTGAGQKSLYQLTLVNNGTVQWLGGVLYVGATPTTVITNAALWEINADASITQGIGGPTPRFVNTGTLRKISGAGATIFGSLQFNNSGLVDVQTGTIQFNSAAGSTFGGSFTVAPSANVQLASGTFTEAGATFSGGGTARMTGGTLTLVNDIMPGFSINGGNVRIASTFQASGAITNLTLNGGLLLGTNEVAGAMTILDGGIEDQLTIRPGAFLTFSTSAQKTLYQSTLINNGTVRWLGGTLYTGSTPTTVITNAGLWEISSDANMSHGIGGLTPQFFNTGTLRKLGGSGVTTFSSLRFVNSGVVDSQSGTIQFSSSINSSLGGTFTAAAGAGIQLANGSFVENGGVFNGAGSLRMTGGTLSLVNNILAGLSLNGGNVQITGPTFQAAGAITNLTLNGALLIGTNEVAGVLVVQDGGIQGQLTVRAGGMLSFTTAAQKTLYESTLINNGTVRWLGGVLYTGSTPTTVITNAGLWEINSDTSMSHGIGGANPQFGNSGTVRKIGGSGTTTFSSLRFVNSGLVESQNGTINFTSSLNSVMGGTFTAAAGAIIQLGNGTFVENGGVFTGAGALRMTGGTLTLMNDILHGLSLQGGSIQIGSTFQNAGAITNLTLNGAILTGTNEISGTMTVLDGGTEGKLTVRSGGTLVFSTAAQKTLYQTTLINNGTVRWLGGTLYTGHTPATLITNAGIWEINSDATISHGIGGANPQFINTGTFRKLGGSGSTTLSSLRFVNAGVIEALSGTIQFTSSLNSVMGGSFVAAAGAIIQLSNGTFVENGGVFSGAGAVRMTGGTLSLVNDILHGLSLNGGFVQINSPTFQAAGAITNLTLNGAILIGTNEVAGTMIVQDGGVEDQLTVRSGGTLTFSSAAQKTLYRTTLINNGNVRWLGGTLYTGSTPTTVITNAGLWEINSDATMAHGIVGSPGTELEFAL